MSSTQDKHLYIKTKSQILTIVFSLVSCKFLTFSSRIEKLCTSFSQAGVSEKGQKSPQKIKWKNIWTGQLPEQRIYCNISVTDLSQANLCADRITHLTRSRCVNPTNHNFNTSDSKV